MHNTFTAAPIRDISPCKDCPDKPKRPSCRNGCQKDAEWHKELERVKGNQREYERRDSVRFKRRCEYGGKP
jgi:hypothetical protein